MGEWGLGDRNSRGRSLSSLDSSYDTPFFQGLLWVKWSVHVIVLSSPTAPGVGHFYLVPHHTHTADEAAEAQKRKGLVQSHKISTVVWIGNQASWLSSQCDFYPAQVPPMIPRTLTCQTKLPYQVVTIMRYRWENWGPEHSSNLFLESQVNTWRIQS